MSDPQIRMPAAAVEALSRGDVFAAIKAVRAAGGGLRDAKLMVETYARQQMGQAADGLGAPTSAHVPGTATSAMPGKIVFPPAASAALGRGEVITAIKLLREANPHLDLKTAKDMVERARKSGAAPADHGAAPLPGSPLDAMRRSERVPTVMRGDGEQPVWLLFGIVLAIAAAAWWAFG